MDILNILPQRGCDAYAAKSEKDGKVPFDACGGRDIDYERPPDELGMAFVGSFDAIRLRAVFFDIVWH